MIDPATASGTKSLLSHLEDFDREKADRETSQDQRALDHRRIREIIDGCGFARWSDVNEPDVLSWLRRVRTAAFGRHNLDDVQAQRQSLSQESEKKSCAA